MDPHETWGCWMLENGFKVTMRSLWIEFSCNRRRGWVAAGLVVLENRLKEDTTAVISQLLEADLRAIMVTGDNLLTAISVARDCEMIPAHDQVVIVGCEEPSTSTSSSKPQLTYTLAENSSLPALLVDSKDVADVADPLPTNVALDMVGGCGVRADSLTAKSDSFWGAGGREPLPSGDDGQELGGGPRPLPGTGATLRRPGHRLRAHVARSETAARPDAAGTRLRRRYAIVRAVFTSAI